MVQFLSNKNILLGVTGSIAAYKSADLVRRLREQGAVVRVVMTENAKRFITPLTMQAVSGNPIHEDLFDVRAEAAMGHIELARWADAIIVAPATADFVARLATGQADDLLTTLCLATEAPIALAPAMNQRMWKHTLTQTNLQALQQKAIQIFEPGEGSQACGDIGPGRMMEVLDIVKKVAGLFSNDFLSGINILITAGPTHETIDPIRYITNGSSGKMGYALAEAAREAGANVTLVSGPVHLTAPMHVKQIDVVSAEEMYHAVLNCVDDCDIFFSVAAVGDYRCETIAKEKIHKKTETLSLVLQRNPDILTEVAKRANRPFIVGFVAETENLLENAQLKKQQKNVDIMVANQVAHGRGMGSDENEVIVLTAACEINLPHASKHKIARELIKIIAEEFKKT